MANTTPKTEPNAAAPATSPLVPFFWSDFSGAVVSSSVTGSPSVAMMVFKSPSEPEEASVSRTAFRFSELGKVSPAPSKAASFASETDSAAEAECSGASGLFAPSSSGRQERGSKPSLARFLFSFFSFLSRSSSSANSSIPESSAERIRHL